MVLGFAKGIGFLAGGVGFLVVGAAIQGLVFESLVFTSERRSSLNHVPLQLSLDFSCFRF